MKSLVKLIDKAIIFAEVNDDFRHKGLRKNLVEKIAAKGITNQQVLDALMAVPRHFFLENAFVKQAYEDYAFQIGAGQTISQPYTVAFQTQLLGVEKGHKVLEIGTGSGYQCAVLCELKAKVHSIERQRELFLKAKHTLMKMGYTPKLRYGDGYEGWDVYAPYDRILITCGAPYIPDALVNQLKAGGKMVIPLGEGEVQEMLEVTKSQDGTVTQRSHGKFKFVPMLPDTER